MKNRFLTLAVTLLVLMSVVAATATAFAGADDISPSISLLRNEITLTKSCVGTGEMTFSLNDFEDTLGIDDLTYITVTALPDAKDGALKLGGIDVMVSQVIPRGSLGFLRFVPAEGAQKATFTFRGSNGGWEKSDVVCVMNFLPTINFAPTAADTKIVTPGGVCAVVALPGSDPDGDEITYEIDEYPSHGVLALKNGTVFYTPEDGYSGRDDFTYRVRDVYGNLSKCAKASITVDRNRAGIVYADMQGNTAHGAAVNLAASGIVCHENIAGVYYFSPDKEVTKNDFVVMLMMASEIDVTEYGATPFADDALIALRHKPYISAAYEMGVIDGAQKEDGIYFEPDAILTRAQAAIMTARLMKLEGEMSLEMYGDGASVPTEAVSAMAGLCENGILTALPSGMLDPNGKLDRAQTAMLLMNMREHNDTAKEKSLLERLFG